MVTAAADPLALPGTADQTATVGVAFSITLPEATGGATPYAYTATLLPAGLSFNANTRVLSGTPTTAQTRNVRYRVTDDDGTRVTDRFIITVSAAPVVPVVLPTTADQTATVGNAFSLTLPAATEGTTPYVYTATGQPPGVNFNATSRVLSGTPTAAGTYTVTYEVTDDAAETASDTFDIVVSAAGQPLALPGTADQTATVGDAFSLTLPAATGGATPYAYTVTGQPAGLTFNATSRVLSGTPTTSGTDTITYEVTDDNGASESDAFDIVVAAADGAIGGQGLLLIIDGRRYSEADVYDAQVQSRIRITRPLETNARCDFELVLTQAELLVHRVRHRAAIEVIDIRSGVSLFTGFALQPTVERVPGTALVRIQAECVGDRLRLEEERLTLTQGIALAGATSAQDQAALLGTYIASDGFSLATVPGPAAVLDFRHITWKKAMEAIADAVQGVTRFQPNKSIVITTRDNLDGSQFTLTPALCAQRPDLDLDRRLFRTKQIVLSGDFQRTIDFTADGTQTRFAFGGEAMRHPIIGFFDAGVVSEPEQADPDGDTGIRLAGATTAARASGANSSSLFGAPLAEAGVLMSFGGTGGVPASERRPDGTLRWEDDVPMRPALGLDADGNAVDLAFDRLQLGRAIQTFDSEFRFTLPSGLVAIPTIGDWGYAVRIGTGAGETVYSAVSPSSVSVNRDQDVDFGVTTAQLDAAGPDYLGWAVIVDRTSPNIDWPNLELVPDDWTLVDTADAISVYDNQNFRLINEIRVVSPGQDGTGVVRVDATAALRQHVATHYALVVKHTASGETFAFQNGALVNGNIEYPLTTAIYELLESRLSADPAIELVMVDTSLPAVDVANLRYADLATRAIRLTSLVRLEVGGVRQDIPNDDWTFLLPCQELVATTAPSSGTAITAIIRGQWVSEATTGQIPEVVNLINRRDIPTPEQADAYAALLVARHQFPTEIVTANLIFGTSVPVTLFEGRGANINVGLAAEQGVVDPRADDVWLIDRVIWDTQRSPKKLQTQVRFIRGSYERLYAPFWEELRRAPEV